MEYQNILKRAWGIVWRNKFLWFLGLLAGGGFSGIGNYSFSSSDWEQFQKLKEEIPADSTNLVQASTKSISKVLGESIDASLSAWEWWVIGAGLLILIVTAIYLSTTARGGIIKAAAKANHDEHIALGVSWKFGHKYFWRMLSLGLISGAAILVVLFILITPVALLAIFSFKVPAIILGVIFALAFLAFTAYLSAIMPMAERMIVLNKKRAFESILEGATFFNRNWKNLLLFYVILFALNIALGISFGVALLGVGLFTFGIGVGLYFLNLILVIIYGVVAGLIILAALLAVSGAIRAFLSTSTTLVFLDLQQKE